MNKINDMLKYEGKFELDYTQIVYNNMKESMNYLDKQGDVKMMKCFASHFAQVLEDQNERLGKLAEVPGFIEHSGRSHDEFWNLRLDLLFAVQELKERVKGKTSILPHIKEGQ